jgi:hypothetical protein
MRDAEGGHPIVDLALLVLFSLSFSYIFLALDYVFKAYPTG